MTIYDDDGTTADVIECSECGHLHFNTTTRGYTRCPLATEGCECALDDTLKRRDEERREQEAGEVLTDFRKGRISAAMRDRLLHSLGYEYEGSQAHRGNNGGGPRHRIGAKG